MFSLATTTTERDVERDISERVAAALKSDEPVRALGRESLLGLAVPAEEGGGGRNELQVLMLLGQVARLDPSLSNVLGVHTLVTYGCLSAWGSPEQKKQWLPPLLAGEITAGFAVTEEGAGSDVQSMSSTAVPDGDGYRLSGTKTYITGADRASVFVATMRHEGGEYDGRVSVFLIPRGDAVTVEPLRPEGQQESGLSRVTFDGWVPADNIVGTPGRGLRVVLGALDFDKLIAAVGAATIASELLEETIQQLAVREQFGGPLLDQDVIKHRIAEKTGDLFILEALIRRAVDLREAGDGRRVLATSAAKAAAAELGMDIVLTAGQFRGVRGYEVGSGVSRAINDLRGYALAGGTTEIQRVIMFRELQKLRQGEVAR